MTAMRSKPSCRSALAFALVVCAGLAAGAAARTLPSEDWERFCTKEDFDECEREFQANAMALVEHEASSRFNAWCSVLQSHESCLKTVLHACRQDGYIKLSSRISATLTEVVNRGCIHRGPSFHSNCNVKHAAAAAGQSTPSQQMTLLKMAESCLKQQHQPKLDDSLDMLLHQLERLTRDMQHLYSRLPQDVVYEDSVDDSEEDERQKESRGTDSQSESKDIDWSSRGKDTERQSDSKDIDWQSDSKDADWQRENRDTDWRKHSERRDDSFML